MSLQEILKKETEAKKEEAPKKASKKVIYFSENNLFCNGIRIKKEGLEFRPEKNEEVEVLESAFKRNYCFKKEE